MNEKLPDLPPGMEWLEYLADTDWWFGNWGGWAVGLGIAVLFNAAFLMIGAWIERKNDRRLARMDAAVAGVRVFVGKPPPGVSGTHRMVQAAIVMAPAPLGRLSILLRRIIGGRVVTRQRDMQRTRRLALLRLREQALAAGAPVVAGVEFCQIGLGKGRFALLVTGTALVGAEPMAAMVTEALGTEPPRHWRELALALTMLVVVTGGAMIGGELADRFAGQMWKRFGVGFWKRHVRRE